MSAGGIDVRIEYEQKVLRAVFNAGKTFAVVYKEHDYRFLTHFVILFLFLRIHIAECWWLLAIRGESERVASL